jgi:hypothetical protein
MTIEVVKMEGKSGALVHHTIPDDPTWGSYISRVEVEDHRVRVGTPRACYQPLSNFELTSIVQLIVGRVVLIGLEATDEVDSFEGRDRKLRTWKTFDLTIL